MKRNGEDWHAIWHAALKNCPYKLRWVEFCDYDLAPYPQDGTDAEYKAWQGKVMVGHYRERYGQLSAMCRILDLPLLSRKGWITHSINHETKEPIKAYTSRGGQRVGHLRIMAYLDRGSRPRDPELRRKVHLLASPFGPTLAMKKLEKLGIAHRYTKP